MTTTRHPTGQDLVCLVCRTDKDIDIDHVVNRGSGGSKERDVLENKVPLCRECHTAKTNGVLETKLFDVNPGEWLYLWRRKGSNLWLSSSVEVSKRYKCLVLSDGAEDSVGGYVFTAQAQGNAPGEKRQREKDEAPSSAPSPSVGQEESDETGSPVLLVGRTGLSSGVGSGSDTVGADIPLGITPQGSHPRSLTHEQRAAIAAGIKEMEWGRQWLAGDTANEWEEELGEDFWNEWANEFGYTYPSLRNAMRVSRQIPEELRNPRLRQSYHVVVAGLPRLSIVLWLHKCEVEDWRVQEFRRQVKGGRPRVKRWTLEELRDLSMEACVGVTDVDAVQRFLNWLGEEEGGGAIES